MSKLAYWVQQHGTQHNVAAWHLLTDCFPREGTTGLAEFATVCRRGATAVRYADGGGPVGGQADGLCAGVSVHGSGRCATVYETPGKACAEGGVACRAATGLSSDDADLWRTAARQA